MLTQHGGDHLLGGGLTGTAGDLHHGNVKKTAIPCRQCPQRQLGIGNLHVELAGHQLFRNPGTQAACRTLLQRHIDVGVAVKALAHQRDKQLSFGRFAAVGGHTGKAVVTALNQNTLHSAAQVPHFTLHHFCSAFLALMDSSTMVSHRSP